MAEVVAEADRDKKINIIIETLLYSFHLPIHKLGELVPNYLHPVACMWRIEIISI